MDERLQNYNIEHMVTYHKAEKGYRQKTLLLPSQ